MTSVPTWLTGLVPILAPAVLAGSTALAGAMLGGRSALRTAERNAALTRQDEQRRWNRERREKAYLTLLERRNQLIEVRRAWAEGDDPHELGFNVEEAEREARQTTDAEQAVREALAVVELAGTAMAVELARTWVQALQRRVRGDLFVDPVLETECRDQFLALIRKELGVDD